MWAALHTNDSVLLFLLAGSLWMLRTNTEQNWNKSEISDCDSVVVFRRATRTNRRPDSMHACSFTTLDPRQNTFNCKREEEEDHYFFSYSKFGLYCDSCLFLVKQMLLPSICYLYIVYRCPIFVFCYITNWLCVISL